MSTYMAKPETVERGWYLLDAEGKTLGTVATEAATIPPSTPSGSDVAASSRPTWIAANS